MLKKLNIFMLKLRWKFVFTILLSFGLVAFFQNCGKGFSSVAVNDSNTSSTLSDQQVAPPDLASNSSFVISQKPQALVNSRDAEVVFSTINPPAAANAYCRIDSLAFVLCNSSFKANALADGTHTIDVQLKNKNNQIVASTSVVFKVDTTAPDLMMNESPSEISGPSASFSFLVSDATSSVASTVCALDNAMAQACQSPQNFSTLAVGSHQFLIRAVDAAGNTREKIISFTVDLTVPNLVWITKPFGANLNDSASFSFSVSNDADNKYGPFAYKCILDASAPVACTSPLVLDAKDEKSHTLSVIAVGKNMVSSNSISYTWLNDHVNPVVKIAKPNVLIGDDFVDIEFTATDTDGSGIKSTTCQLDNQPLGSCTSPLVYRYLSVGSHQLNVISTDNAGLVSQGLVSWVVADSIITKIAQYKQTSGTCGVTLDGKVKCWGSVGIRDTISYKNYKSPLPIEIPGIRDAVAVSSGASDQGCALDSLGNVSCWQNGNPAAAVSKLSNVGIVINSASNSCALTTAGQVYCWGSGSLGELGLGDVQSASEPTLIAGLSSIKYLTAGSSQYCVITDTNAVKCWGQNYHKLFDPTKSFVSIPTLVAGFTGVKSVAVSFLHICSVTSNNTVKCLGNDNYSGQLGGASEVRLQNNTLLSNVKSLSIAQNSSCALTLVGDIYCWGKNYNAHLGSDILNEANNGESAFKVSLPLPAVSLNGTCALLNDNSLRCWGDNQYSPTLGLNNKTTVGEPTALSVVPSAASITTSFVHSCAITNTGSVNCWGLNGALLLGPSNSWLSTSLNPAAVPGVTDAKQLSTEHQKTCALSGSGVVSCWGNLKPGVSVMPGMGNVTQISSGAYFTCALNSDKHVFCWGSNYAGQLGKADTTLNSDTPLQIGGLENVVQISTGWDHICAVIVGGKLKCWGSNFAGELGFSRNAAAPSEPHAVPTEVLNLPNVTSVAASAGYFTCALTANQEVYCWGYQPDKLSNSIVSQPVPKIISGLKNVVQIAAGFEHTCALVLGGKTYCWGMNSFYQFGKISDRALFAEPTLAFKGQLAKKLIMSPLASMSGFISTTDQLMLSGKLEGLYLVPTGALLDR